MGIIRDISEIVNAIEKDAATYFFGNDNMKSTGLRMASNVRMNQPMATSMPRRSPTQAPAVQTNASKPQGRTGVLLRGTTPVHQLQGAAPVGPGRGKLYLKGTTPIRQLYGTAPVSAGSGRQRLAGTSSIYKFS